jgi:hypothetical protein
MGEKKTPESFRASCERFIFLDIIDAGDSGSQRAGADSYGSYSQIYSAEASSGSSAEGSGRGASQQTASRRKRAAVSETAASYKTSPAKIQEEPEADQDFDSDSEASFTDKATIEAAIVSIITDNNAEGKETGLGEIGSRLVKIFPDFDVRNYHYSKLSEYLKDFPSLKVENRDNAVWVSLNSSPDSEIEQQILRIFKKHDTDDMYLATLKKELLELNPNLEASIRRSGVTRFSVYLNRMIGSVEVNGRHVLLKK